MNLDDVLFGMIIGGAGLCAAHFRSEYIRWREHRDAERRKEVSMRQLHFIGSTAPPSARSHRESPESDRPAGVRGA